MKAVTRYRYENPEILHSEEVSWPSPSAHQPLVRGHCSTVNRTDCHNLTGKPYVSKVFTGLRKPLSPDPSAKGL